MLMVVFQLGDERYAVQADCVIEIVPILSVTPAPQAPDYVSGLFNYKTHVTPVIDLCQLALRRPCRQLLSSRIILVDYDRVLGRTDVAPGSARVLGLMAERVTEICKRPPTVAAAPLAIAQAPYLAGIFYTGAEMNQCMDLSALLPASVREMLYTQVAPSEAGPGGMVTHVA